MPSSATRAATSAVDAETPARLRAVVGKLSRRINAATRGSTMTPSQLSVLGSIARQGPMRLSDLAEIETLNPTMLSRIVANLDDAGLVHRRNDPDDRRAGLVEVTASGRRTHDRLRAQRATVLLDGLHTLDPRDVAAVEAALPALEQLVEALNRR
jgi:DNA-binding MarR family transcriptional regulator